MEQEDITYYLVAQSEPAEGVLKKIVEICEAVDFTGSPKSIFYNGLEGFDKDVHLEFEISPADALKESEKYIHSNFTFLEWHNDELLRELADLLEETLEKTQAKVDSVSLLTGNHEILSLEKSNIVKATFSLAFYFEQSTSENIADLNLATDKDPDFQSKIKLLEEICKCQFKGFWGGS
ncbi:MAG: hypothetical protein NE334_11550 [Lentisphaeraceae bacterium]|nr:hypothetical protein [Lentisphaeraceae bacterium]